MRRQLTAVGIVLALAASAPPARANQAGCEAFVNEDFSSLPEAATHLLGANWSAATDNQAEYCEVTGYV
ncbi:MAG: hypothetical protein V3R81_10230, partial [Gammaproteobacteria bacterium]